MLLYTVTYSVILYILLPLGMEVANWGEEMWESAHPGVERSYSPAP